MSKSLLKSSTLIHETIISSDLAYLETNMDGLQIYRYSDYKLSVVKSILYNPFGGCERNKSVILRDNTQVYDGRSAIKVDTWLSHLKSVANSVKVEKQKTYTYKKDDYNY